MSASRLLLTSIPKSGTHLLTTVINRIFEQEVITVAKRKLVEKSLGHVMRDGGDGIYAGHFRHGHDYNLPEDYKVVVLIRDPRDILLSARDYMTADRKMNTRHKQMKQHLLGLDYNGQLQALLDGIDLKEEGTMPSLSDRCGGFVEWRAIGASVVKYEDFFSNDAAQTIGKAILPYEFEQQKIQTAIEQSLGSPSKTLNRGVAARWKTELPSEVMDRNRQTFEKILSDLNYF